MATRTRSGTTRKAARKAAGKTARKPSRTSKTRSGSGARVTELVKLFQRFLEQRQITLSPSNPAGGVEAAIAFQASVPIGGKNAHERSDLLQFRFASIGSGKWRRTTISIARQLYAGPGKTHRLVLDWIYDVGQLDLGTRAAHVWSNEFGTLMQFAARVHGELGTLGSLPAARAVEIRLERA